MMGGLVIQYRSLSHNRGILSGAIVNILKKQQKLRRSSWDYIW